MFNGVKQFSDLEENDLIQFYTDGILNNPPISVGIVTTTILNLDCVIVNDGQMSWLVSKEDYIKVIKEN